MANSRNQLPCYVTSNFDVKPALEEVLARYPEEQRKLLGVEFHATDKKELEGYINFLPFITQAVIVAQIPWDVVKAGNPDSYVRGVVAHEMGHLMRSNNLLLFSAYLLNSTGNPMLKRITRPLLRREEARVDREAIKRGFGHDLLYALNIGCEHTGTARSDIHFAEDEFRAELFRHEAASTFSLLGLSYRREATYSSY